jgi:ribose transport system ATP-binding protein
MGEVSRDELIRLMVGRPVAEYRQRVAGPGESAHQPRLVVDNLTLRGNPREAQAALRGVSLQVRPGEIVGLAGLMGAGRSEILGSIFGAYPSSSMSGVVAIGGHPYRRRSPAASIRLGLALVAEDRKSQNLILDQSVTFNSTLAALRRYARGGWVLPGGERQAVRDQVRRLGTRTPGISTAVKNLSGGNQQKVVVGKWLLTSPSVILLDEPTRGIDVGAKAEIHALVAGLAATGVAFLVVSSELPELLSICHRILVVRDGRISAECDAASATQEDLLAAAMPLGDLARASQGVQP